MERLSISKNSKYLMQGEKPFFWLGDTAWLMFQKLDKKETYNYLKNRLDLGFNVIQAVLMNSKPSQNAHTSLPLGDKDYSSNEYWLYCDEIIEMAHQMGLYLGILPAWGSLVKSKVLTEENIEEYIEFLAKRYQKYENIIWILGGDIRGDVNKELYIKAGKMFKKYNPEALVSFHPFGRTSSSIWFNGEEWLDFNMFQSGHRRYDQIQLGVWDDNISTEEFYGEDSFRYVKADHGKEILKPTLDGEPSYEGIPQGLHNPRNEYWEEWDARRYAYWNIFEGAAGHTYGCNAIMQFCGDKADEKRAYGVRESWKDAIHYPGAAQMQHLKNLMLSVDFTKGNPNESILMYGQKERYHRVSVFASDDFLFCYTYSGDEFMLDLSAYKEKKMQAYWMNPETGSYGFIDTITNEDSCLFSPLRRKAKANDWVLVLRELK